MQTNFTFDGIEGTEALKSYTQTRLNSLQTHGENINKIHVILRHDNKQHIAEANLHIAGKDINAKASSKDMYASIDELIKKLESQLKKYKEKHTDHHHD